MRFILCSAVFLAACSQEPAPSGLSAGIFAGEGRDALCIAGDPGVQRAGFITYGRGDANCSARGRIVAEGGGFALLPMGEGECRIPFAQDEAGVKIGPLPAACSYYCGPDVKADGKSFRRVSSGDSASASSNPMVDLGGDPLC
ncbi:hypothetical protein D3M59_02670 [Sphingomonas edaphi]|uniref:Uncharacterized protein n=2 Tax=Sphingomonas edaphi TaxID=2315689 RepID=A0A418Q1S9_9SPHN|nr:hypothetical protein D3M59_02670 [Sphingomonas edaphi]